VGDSIFGGLRRAVGGGSKAVTSSGRPRGQLTIGQPPAGGGGAVAGVGLGVIRAAGLGRAFGRRAVGWAAEQAIAPNSVTGIAFLIALCAAAWLSGGTRADTVRGAGALVAWALARVGARQLQAITGRRDRGPAGAALGAAYPADWLALPGYDLSTDEPGARGRATARPGARVDGFAWPFAVSTVAAQCAAYGGIAAGGAAAGWTQTWPLAVVAVICLSVAEIARTCGQAVSADLVPRQARRGPAILSSLQAVLPPPVGVRVVLAALVMVRYGPRVALFLVCVIEVIALARVIVGHRARSPASTGSSAIMAQADCAAQDVLLCCRDDGPFARWTGRLIRGNLTPLPPALAGLVAITLLAALGIGKLPGVLALTPVVVLLLAASGASHPHDGRFDWLVPALIGLCQYIYLGSLGFARSVPGSAVFATCSMTAVWYAGLGIRTPADRPDHPGARLSRPQRIRQVITRRGDGIGWEGRLCVVGLTSVFGITTFGYLGLAAYLAALMCGKVVAGYLIPGEDQRP
jgi:hypothetical protein